MFGKDNDVSNPASEEARRERNVPNLNQRTTRRHCQIPFRVKCVRSWICHYRNHRTFRLRFRWMDTCCALGLLPVSRRVRRDRADNRRRCCEQVPIAYGWRKGTPSTCASPESRLRHLGHGDSLFDKVACCDGSWAEWCANASTTVGDHMRQGLSGKRAQFSLNSVCICRVEVCSLEEVVDLLHNNLFLVPVDADSTSTEVVANARVRTFSSTGFRHTTIHTLSKRLSDFLSSSLVSVASIPVIEYCRTGLHLEYWRRKLAKSCPQSIVLCV